MSDLNDRIPAAFQWKWLVAPAVILILAAALVLLFPSLPPAPAIIPVEEVPLEPESSVTQGLSTETAKAIALTQCDAVYDCSEVDCLEKVLTHVDSSTKHIYAVLRTPAPKAFRDRLRAAIARGVNVQLILDSSLNPKFYLANANIHVKNVTNFVATNFLIVDDTSVIVGSNPQTYASPPDIIEVACKENEKEAYTSLFLRLWETESNAFTSISTEEEVLSEEQISSNASNEVCSESSCPPDTFVCQGTTKMWQNYFCLGSSCAYELLPLYFSSDCGYSNPGFGANGEPLIIITETEFDEQQSQTEFIEFTSLQSLELSGFTLLRNGVPLITFPSPYILNGAARVFTGSGTNTTTQIFLGSSTPLWAEPNTVATLVNPNGNVVAQQTLGG